MEVHMAKQKRRMADLRALIIKNSFKPTDGCCISMETDLRVYQ